MSTVVDVIAAPKAAFERLRDVPMWGWAFIITIVLALIGTILEGPATRHASVAFLAHMQQTNPIFAGLSDAKKQQMLANAAHPPVWQQAIGWVQIVIVILVTVLLNSVVLLVGNAAGKGQADFKRLWCASMNIAVPTLGIGLIVWGAITLARGADSFNSIADVSRAMPSIGTLVPTAQGALAGFLGAISIFTIWGMFLNAAALMIVARVSKGLAYGVAVAILVLGALLQAGAASLFHY
ncbi:MAG TPA: YIP1 family protein [Candidatus Baltobacteraceae bacterium]